MFAKIFLPKCYVIFLLSILVFFAEQGFTNQTQLPIVIWHGLGDSCCSLNSYPVRIKNIIEQSLPGAYVHLIQIGTSSKSQIANSMFMPVSKQIEIACSNLKNDPILKHGYNAIGISQGGQFMRGLAQRCPVPRMKVLITLGSQHQGVNGLPQCQFSTFCPQINQSSLAYGSLTQQLLVPASYWHDPLNEEGYRNSGTFLADINNENEINKNYIRNLQRLKKFVMVKFNQDTMVVPIDSGWFSWYNPQNTSQVLRLNETYLYTSDRLGLKKMDRQGKLVFLDYDDDHVIFTTQWFNKQIIPYLKI